MTTSTDLPNHDVIDRARGPEQLSAYRRSRVWRAPRRTSIVGVDHRAQATGGAYAAGLVAVALITGGVLTMAQLDDGPDALRQSDAALGSMFNVVDQIGARTLWEQGVTGAGVNVAVIDTGIAPVSAFSTPGKVRAAVDLSSEAGDPATAVVDNFGHGTHLAGIIAGRDPGADPASSGNEPEVFLGVAPDAGIVSVKVAGRDGGASPQQVAEGVDWVVAHADELDIDVLTIAFDSGSGGLRDSDPLAAAIERAWSSGIVVVAAAGNAGADAGRLSSPANLPTVIAVGGVEATSDGFVIPEWASSGDGVRNPDLAAPGAHIQSLRAPGSAADVEHPEGFVDSERFLGSGSSQSAAVVSGAVALLLSARPGLSPDEVERLLVTTADPVAGSSTIVGAGVIDVAAAVKAVSTDTAAATTHPDAVTSETPWTGSSWTGSSWTGSSWTGSSWTGSSWTGSSWTGSSWTGSSWTGSSWTGSSWTGSSWTGSSWTGSSWTGSSWTGSSWTGSSWTGSSWTGSSWTGSSWTGSSWTGSSWTGSSWTGSSWT